MTSPSKYMIYFLLISIYQACRISFSLHHPNFRQKTFTPKNAYCLAIPNSRQSLESQKYDKIDSQSLKYTQIKTFLKTT